MVVFQPKKNSIYFGEELESKVNFITKHVESGEQSSTPVR